VRTTLRRHSYLIALGLAGALLIANVIALPSFISPGNLPGDLGLFAPLALVALASTPAILSGGGGVDISIGPLMNFTSIILVLGLLPHWFGRPEFAIVVVLLIGATIGAINGVLVTVFRYPSVIATLCTFFVLGGANLALAPNPSSAPANWTSHIAGSVGPVPGGLITIGAVLLAWGALQRTALYRTLMAVGANHAAAFSAGVDVTSVRILAYACGGLFAGVAGIALTGLVQSADSSYGTQYALIGLAAVALGGTPLIGGRGGLIGSLAGALTIFLLQNLLQEVHVAVVWVQVVYGALLVGSVALSAMIAGRPQAQGAT
jgi:ribose transport system permease protein